MKLSKLIFTIMLVAFSAASLAQDNGTWIYKGGDLAPDGIKAGSWGSGTVSTSKERVLVGAQSIKITTQGLYSGGCIDFQNPVFVLKADDNSYIQFSLFFQETRTVNPGAGQMLSMEPEPYVIPTVNTMRFIFTSESGKSTGIELPTSPIDPEDNWLRIIIPVSKLLDDPSATDVKIKRIVFTADLPATVFLSEIKLVNDSKPIKVEKLDQQSVALGDIVCLPSEAYGGLSTLVYSWDFDAKDGIQVDSTDRIGLHNYYKPGDYTVTLTVSDYFGIKKPVTVTTKISVDG